MMHMNRFESQTTPAGFRERLLVCGKPESANDFVRKTGTRPLRPALRATRVNTTAAHQPPMVGAIVSDVRFLIRTVSDRGRDTHC